MPNITVLRVSSAKHHKRSLLHILLWLGLSLIIIVIYITFFFDSIKYLESESIRFVRTTNLKTLEKVIFYSVPVFNPDLNSKKKLEKGLNNGGLRIFSFEKILQGKYPVLLLYPFNSSEIDNNQKTANGLKENLNKKDEAEDNENKEAKIYSKTVLVKERGIIIRNHTNYKIDISRMLSEPISFKLSKKDTSVVILHTHTTEAYMPENKSKTNINDSYRTTLASGNVTRVGLALKKQLSIYKVNAFQDVTIHDYPEYLGAYSRSLKTTLKDLKKYAQAKIVFDIHRDAYGEKEGTLRAAEKINGYDAAKIMFVVGTNEMGLEHKGWRENLKLAVKLQDKANKIYPGLCREIDLRKERFNQHSAPGALIVEVGGTGNTISEAERSMKYLAQVISETFKTK
ncbi:MAG: stage II sporulation protein P [Deltaproteobacteria bacterium]